MYVDVVDMCWKTRQHCLLKKLVKAKNGLKHYLTDGKTEGGTVSCILLMTKR